ncbi:MAG: hypothetical protein IIA63_05875 [Nitrospinae bacterium]|nr:hypothetical protein [Nitrospinota bacterium]
MGEPNRCCECECVLAQAMEIVVNDETEEDFCSRTCSLRKTHPIFKDELATSYMDGLLEKGFNPDEIYKALMVLDLINGKEVG